MIDLKEYIKNQIIINNKEIILNINNDEKIIKLNKENNYLNLLNNLISNINLTFKYSLQSCGSMYYDYFKNNEKEEINKYNLTNYLVNCILYYVYNFEKDKINDLNKIICYNFIYKKDEIINNNINYIRIFFKRTFFKDIFNLNLNLKINFSNLHFKEFITNFYFNCFRIIFMSYEKNIYIKSINDNLICYMNNYSLDYTLLNNYYILCFNNNSLCSLSNNLYFNYDTNINNDVNNKDENKDEDKKEDEEEEYIKEDDEKEEDYIEDNIQKNDKIYLIENLKIKMIELLKKYKIDISKMKNYYYTNFEEKIYIKDENNEYITNKNNCRINIKRYIFYIKLDNDIKKLNLKEINYLGIVSERKIFNKKLKPEQIKYYIIIKQKYRRKWIILYLMNNNNMLYNHSLTISKFLKKYNNNIY